jgi:predicted AAA+ superfamily ATPase
MTIKLKFLNLLTSLQFYKLITNGAYNLMVTDKITFLVQSQNYYGEIMFNLIQRPLYVELIKRHLRIQPICAILGARQVGKTSLARQFTKVSHI